MSALQESASAGASAAQERDVLHVELSELHERCEAAEMERDELRERCAEQDKTIDELRRQLESMSQEAETHEKERTEVSGHVLFRFARCFLCAALSSCAAFLFPLFSLL